MPAEKSESDAPFETTDDPVVEDVVEQWSDEDIEKLTQLAVPLFHDLINGRYRGYDPNVAAEQSFALAAVLFRAQRRIAESGTVPELALSSKSKVSAPNLEKGQPVFDYIEAGEPGPGWWDDHDSIDHSSVH